MERVVKGIVVSGVSDGSKYVNIYKEVFVKEIGIEPFPGTLNIVIWPPHLQNIKSSMGERSLIVVRPPLEGLANVRCMKAHLSSRKGRSRSEREEVYIIMPERTVTPGYVVEVIAASNLRDKLNLKDGDMVEIIIP